MKFLIFIIGSYIFSAQSVELNKLQSEFVISINGKENIFLSGEYKKLNIDGKEIGVEIKLGEFKTFDNYGIQFQLPNETTGYLDVTNEKIDIWNFDYLDSFFMLMVLKNSEVDLDNAYLADRLRGIAKKMHIETNNFLPVEYYQYKGVGAIGTFSGADLLLEQYGFSTENYKFLVFTYSALINKKNMETSQLNNEFKKTIFKSLVY